MTRSVSRSVGQSVGWYSCWYVGLSQFHFHDPIGELVTNYILLFRIIHA